MSLLVSRELHLQKLLRGNAVASRALVKYKSARLVTAGFLSLVRESDTRACFWILVVPAEASVLGTLLSDVAALLGYASSLCQFNKLANMFTNRLNRFGTNPIFSPATLADGGGRNPPTHDTATQ